MRPVLLLPLLAPALIAQGVVTFGSREPRVALDLAGVIRRIPPQGIVAVLDGGPRKALGDLCDKDPLLVAREMSVKTLSKVAGEALQRREGWEPGPRWAVLDAKGRVVGSGQEVPTGPALDRLCREGGLVSLEAQLDAFLRSHPDHAGARAARAALRAQVCKARIRDLVDLPPAVPEPRLKAPLSPEQAKALWGPALEDLQRLLEDGGWLVDGGSALMSLVNFLPMMDLDPLNQSEACARRLEQELEAYPRLALYLWSRLARGPEAPLRQARLQAGVEPLPGARPMSTANASQLRRKGDWSGLLALAKPRWQDMLKMQVQIAQPKDREAILEGQWRNGAEALVEAHLRLGQFAEATKVVEETVAWAGDAHMAGLAGRLARSLEQPTLAAQWEVLVPANLPGPGPLVRLARRSAKDGGLWAVLESEGDRMASGLRRALKELGTDAPDLPVVTVAGAEVEALKGVLQGARSGWVLLDDAGQVRGAQTGVPDRATVKRLAEGAGFQARIPALRAYLKRHPDHAEAQIQLLELGLRGAFSQLPAGAGDLDPQTDARMFGEWASLLQRVAAGGAHRTLRGGVFDFRPEGERSPLLRAAARRALPVLEDWLEREGGQIFTWRLWAALNGWTGHSRSALALWNRCPQAPGGTMPSYFPDARLAPVIRELKRARQWRELRDFLEAQRDRYLDELSGTVGRPQPHVLEGIWEAMGPLVEAHLRVGDEGPATMLVQDLLAREGGPSLVRQASTLALACGKPELARQWSALESAKPKDGEVLTLGK